MAQQNTASTADAVLPDAPGVDSTAREANVGQNVTASGTIAGTVTDTNGDVVEDARLILRSQTGATRRSVHSGVNGEFSFPQLPPGTYQLTISGRGMGTVVKPGITLVSGAVVYLSTIVVPLRAAATEVKVFATREQEAQVEVHQEETQRVFGVFPNFYSSYNWNAAPMDAKQKFQLALRAVTDPLAFVGAAGVAGAEQINHSFPGYGYGIQGYAQRFGAQYANDVSSRMLGGAVFPSLFHQDPRYFYMGTGTARARVMHAIAWTFVCRADNGRSMPNYSQLLGSFASSGLSNLYYPPGSRGVTLVVANGLIETVGSIGTNLMREFVLRGITSNAHANGAGRP